MKNNKTLILYQYNKFTRDLTYIKEYYDKKEIESDFKSVNIKNIRKYIIKDIEKIDDTTTFLRGNYLLIRG